MVSVLKNKMAVYKIVQINFIRIKVSMSVAFDQVRLKDAFFANLKSYIYKHLPKIKIR